VGLHLDGQWTIRLTRLMRAERKRGVKGEEEE
jgi:hypothetical protein